ncbi:MAG: hypothetical protein DRZ76_02965 [Candidatus Nealsonbacteria bacterium]|nr:MAG: hypothetical protein DRZ76_02965 [Candidatus Nealsonbacteria bacterium]
MKTYKIDWYLTAGKTYKLQDFQVLVIRKLGTNASSEVKINIDGKYCGSIISKLAPLNKDTTNILPPLDLKDLYLVVPPSREYIFEGPGTVRILGELIELDPGETMPADLIARYNEQTNKYVTYVYSSVDLGTDTTWAAGSEITLFEKKLESHEKMIFNNVIRIDQEQIGTDPGKVAIKLYRDDNPWHNRYADSGEKGIDLKAFLIESGKLEYFTLEKEPLVLEPDHKLKFTAENISGSDITPASGTSIKFYFYAVITYINYIG